MTDANSASKVEADNRKIFVGGLSWETTVEDLKTFMEQYGVVKDVTIKSDQMGNPRGFGFVLFESESSVDQVLATETLTLKDKKIEAKKASVKEIKQIFVGGVNPQTPEEDIRTHFEQFGEIETINLPKDATKGTRRGFVFITFATVDACNAATEKGNEKQQLGENNVDVKKAVPQKPDFGGGQYDSGYGGFGYGGYGYAPYGMPYGRGGTRGRGAPRGRGAAMPPMVGYPPYNPYDPYSGYGYPPVASTGGGKMRGRGRGAARGAL